jgi:hypothetical protein
MNKDLGKTEKMNKKREEDETVFLYLFSMKVF